MEKRWEEVEIDGTMHRTIISDNAGLYWADPVTGNLLFTVPDLSNLSWRFIEKDKRWGIDHEFENKSCVV